ncbi:MAG: hypothetical protein GY865_18280, partial [candidate division Zixibacteria bacterium]|nr:hypothetical protein [candidate division Zixibacteria bacterium]
MLRDKLSKLDKHFNPSGKKQVNSKDEANHNRYHVAQNLLGGEICEFCGGSFLKIKSNFNSEYKHGNLTVHQLNEFVSFRDSHFEQYGAQETIDIEKLLFFD